MDNEIDKTGMADSQEYTGTETNDVTMPGKRERKSDERFAVGDLIMDRYKVLAELGQGGMGVVYKCFDETAGIEVALKTLPSELSHNVLEMDNIRDNFQLIHNLHHPHIASYNNLERDTINGNYYLILENCVGEDLRRWLRRKRKENSIKVEEVLNIIQQIAEALDYAHEMKIIHRDIKPGNIMIDQFEKIKVLDFGLAAQLHSSMTRISMAYHGTTGTGPYMAPEQWRGRSQGAPADQYALAVMTYEIFAGHLPFESTDATVLREAVLCEQPENINNLPRVIQEAIKRAMSKDPDERFANCSEFVAAMRGKKIKPSPKQKKKVFPIWAKVLIFTVLLSAAGIGGYYFFNGYLKKQDRIAKEKAEKERLAKIAAEKAEKERLAKIAAEKAEKERLAKIAAEKADKERLAKIAAEKAEKERLAKIAAEKAEKERLAKIAAEKAEKERFEKLAAEEAETMRLAILAEERLDSENATLRMELRNKLAEITQKNYGSGQTFEQKLKELNTTFVAAENTKLSIDANKKLKSAKQLADWLLLNGELRVTAKTLMDQAKRNRSAADKYEPETYADGLYNNAVKIYQAGEKLYKDLKFADAKQNFEEAAKIFERAKNTAFSNKLNSLSDQAKKMENSAKWDEVKILAKQIQPLNAPLGDQLILKADKALKAIAIEKKLTETRNAKSAKQWQSVLNHANAVLELDSTNTEALSLKQEAVNKLIPTLTIFSYIEGQPVKANVKSLKTLPDQNSNPWKLQKNLVYEFEVTYKTAEHNYYSKIPAFICNWNGPKNITVDLKKIEFTGTIECNGVPLEMAYINAGTFVMGSSIGERGRVSGETRHVVTLTRPFWLGKYEVTQAQYKAVMGTNPSFFNGPKRPVEKVSWNEAKDFCNKLNELYSDRLPRGYKFDLPTEAQWEYACRAATTTALNNNKDLANSKYNCNNLAEIAWYHYKKQNSQTHDVGLKKPNTWGLYDMHGNVFEWCRDCYESYSDDAIDPFVKSASGMRRVYRGGAYNSIAAFCRAAYRSSMAPGERNSHTGFRLALVSEK